MIQEESANNNFDGRINKAALDVNSKILIIEQATHEKKCQLNSDTRSTSVVMSVCT
jgi:hypothetical protein